MRKLLIPIFALSVLCRAWSQEVPAGLAYVEGGTFKHTKSNFFAQDVTIAPFYIGKHEVTQKEWRETMGNDPSHFKGDNLPVDSVNWYDCVEYCNQRSVKEGLQPYYRIAKEQKDSDNQNEIDDIKWKVTINAGANGYRLPTEAEWEYAAGGGQMSQSLLYSGSDDVDEVGWYWRNSGDKPLTGFWLWPVIERNKNRTHPVGEKKPNELGLYDMSGNVREWCWNWYGDTAEPGMGPERSAAGRVWKGGGWMGGEFCCPPAFRASYEASGRGPDQGLRLCRDKTNAASAAK